MKTLKMACKLIHYDCVITILDLKINMIQRETYCVNCFEIQECTKQEVLTASQDG